MERFNLCASCRFGFGSGRWEEEEGGQREKRTLYIRRLSLIKRFYYLL
jgi:NMD protein affecting ribosome stability and mRNA decay